MGGNVADSLFAYSLFAYSLVAVRFTSRSPLAATRSPMSGDLPDQEQVSRSDE
jgi:hypothetical protein